MLRFFRRKKRKQEEADAEKTRLENESSESKSKNEEGRPSLEVESLEARIMLSATWVDPDAVDVDGGMADVDAGADQGVVDLVNSLPEASATSLEDNPLFQGLEVQSSSLTTDAPTDDSRTDKGDVPQGLETQSSSLEAESKPVEPELSTGSSSLAADSNPDSQSPLTEQSSSLDVDETEEEETPDLVVQESSLDAGESNDGEPERELIIQSMDAGAAGSGYYVDVDNVNDGDSLTFDGATENGHLNLSDFARDDVRFEYGQLAVDLPDGGSFTIDVQNLEQVDFSDGSANVFVWDAGGDTSDWDDPNNWSGSAPPGPDDILIFDGSPDTSVALSGEIGGILVGPGYSGTISLAGALTISGDIDLDSGTIDAGAHALTVVGAASVDGGTLRGDSLAFEGDLDVSSGNLDLSNASFTGDGNQTLSISNGENLENVQINKSGGTLTLAGSIEISGNFEHVQGSVDASTSSVEFQGWNASIDGGDIQFNDVVLDGNVLTLTGGDLDVDGTLSIEKVGTLSGGEILAGGDVITSDTAISGDGAIRFNGDGDQTLSASGAIGEINNLVVDKAAGTLTITDHIQISGNLEHAQGTVDATTSTVEFQGWNATIDGGDIQFNDVILDGNVLTLVDGDLDVDGTLTIEKVGTLSGGEILAGGDVITGDTAISGDGAIRFNGDGDQTLSASGAIGEINNLVVDKAAGTLTITDHIQISGNLEHAQGTVDATTSTVEFQGWNATIDGGDIQFNDVILDGNVLTLVDGDLDVDGTLTIEKVGTLSGGEILAGGDVITGDTAISGDGAIRFNGDGDQTLSASGAIGEINNLVVDKAAGTLTITDHIQISGNLEHAQGSVDASTSTVEFQGWNATIDGGDIQFNDVILDGNVLTLVDGDLDVDGTLTIEKVGTLSGGEILAGGDVITGDTAISGDGAIRFNGDGDQTLSASGSVGEINNLVVDKAAGTLTITDHIQISGNLEHAQGTVDATTSTVEFQGWNATIDGGDIQFNDVILDGNVLTLVDGDLDVDGTLTIEKVGTLSGSEILAGGDVITGDTAISGDGAIRFNGDGDQTLSASGSIGEINNLVVDKAAGTLTITDHIQISGNLEHAQGTVDASTSTVEFQGWNATIDGGDIQFNDVILDGNVLTLVDGDLDVDGTLTIEKLGTLSGGDLLAGGDIVTTDTAISGDAVIRVDGAGDQTISASGGVGELSNVSIDKTGGTLTLEDHIQISGNLEHVQGTVDASSSTIEFQGWNATIDGGDIQFNDVILDGNVLTLVDGDLDVDGTLTIEKLGTLSGGDLLAGGDIVTTDTAISGDAVIRVDGAGDQTISASGGVGELSNVSIDKTGGTLTLEDHIQISGNLEHVQGTVDASSSTIEFQGWNATIDGGDIQFNDVILDGNVLTLVDGDLDVDGTLTIEKLGTLSGGDLLAGGDIVTTDTAISGDAVIRVDGAGDQTISASGGAGELSNVSIDKAGGILTLEDQIQISGDFHHVQGTVDAGTSTVEFQGWNASVDAGGVAFNDVILDVNVLDISGELRVTGDLTIEKAGTLQDAVIRVDGDVTSLDNSISGNPTIILTGEGATVDMAGANDFLRFENISSGSHYTILGDSGFDTIDLQGYPAGSVSDDGSMLTVDLPEGGSFTISHDAVEEILVNDGPTTPLPGVDAGDDLSVNENEVVTLSGQCHDTEGGAFSYEWTQVSGPAVTLDDPSSTSPSFTAPEGLSNSVIVFELQASDGTDSYVDTVNITVNADDDAPTANAGPAQSIAEGETVQLDGGGVDPEGQGLTYSWVQVSGPTVTLDDPTSPSPNFTAPEQLSDGDIEFELHVSDGTNESVDTVVITVEADNDPPIANAGPDVRVDGGTQVTLSAGGAGTTIDLNDFSIDSYGGSSQDIATVATVEEDGSTLHMSGNGWKSIEFPTTITEDTVLSFEFKATTLGEIHGIGFDNDSSLSPDQTFKLGGTQTWGIPDAVDAYSDDGEWVRYEIPIGEFYTGDFNKLFFVNDHDGGSADAESFFRNITINDGSQPAPTHDAEGEELTYTWVQTSGPPVVLDDPHSTNPTFTAPDGLTDVEVEFELRVSDGTTESIDTVHITIESDYQPPVANAGPDISVEPGDLVTLSAGGGTTIDLDDYSIDSYGGSSQDIATVATVEGDGSTLHMSGNGWKSIEFPTTITEDTVLTFEFKATNLGEIHGIGFDNDSSLSAEQTFKLAGTQTWGIRDAVDPYPQDGDWVRYEIPIGEFYTGDFDKLFFVNDHDGGAADAESFFRNITISDGSQPAPTHDADGEELSYTWVQTSGPPVVLDDPHATNPTFTAPDGLSDVEVEFELRVSDGTTESIDTVHITIESNYQPPVANAGPDARVEPGDLVTLSAGGGTTVDLDDYSIDSYGGSSQDIATVATVEGDGSTLHMSGNGWKSIEFPTTITEDTVLSFEFKATTLGEIHGIGFDNDSSLSPGQTFKVGGTQTWGIDNAVEMYADDGEWMRYEIPIGEFYTGDFDKLFFVNDHDGGSSDAESFFRNITISDGSQPAPTHDSEGEELSYTWVQTGGPPVVLDDPHSTNPTFTAPEGVLAVEVEFELRVSDGTTESIDTVIITIESNDTPPIANAGPDDTVDEGDLVTLSAVGGATVDFDDFSIDSYGGSSQDIATIATVEDGGSTLHMSGNGWKSIEFPTTITEDTVLSFEFKATTLGEIHGIGFDNDSSLSPDQTFKLAGTQTWGIGDAVDNYDGDGEWMRYEIPIGEFYTGDFENLFFVNDHDGGAADAESFFRNITISDGTQAAPSHDPEGEALTYTWVQTSGPAVVLDDPHATNPSFTAPEGLSNTQVEFELQVSDGTHTSVDTVTIHVNADNDAPSADAGPDLVVDENESITLQGSGTDPEGQGLTYNWVQVSGPTIALDDPTSATPSLSAPEGLSNSQVVFELQVSDGTSTSVDTVNITLAADNDAPTAEAGPDLSVAEEESITLQGSGTDPEGQGLTYSWVQVSGPPVILDDPTATSPTFTAPESCCNTEIVFELEVSDGTSSSVDTVLVTVNADNDAPTAEAGPDLTVDENESITLQGSGSDPEGNGLSYQWIQLSGPPATLDDPTSPSPSFTAPEGLSNSVIVFEILVSDGTNTSVDTVNITVNADDDAPTAEAGPDLIVDENESITLQGSGSDPEGQGLTYQWVQISGPSVTLDDPGSANPSFTAPEGLSNSGVVFELQVSDGTNTSVDTVNVTLNADNDAPTAEAGPNLTVDEHESITLQGSGSDPEGEGLTYQWVQISGPAVSLDDATSATPSFTAPEGLSNSEVVFELQVSDGTNTSVDTVNVSINADNDAPTAEAGPDLIVDENESITLQGSGTDPEDQGLTYRWVQVSGPAASLDDPTSATPTFTAPEGLSNSEVVFELQVSDGTNTAVDTVNISVNADNDAPTAEAGPDLVVDENESITLQGSGTDPEDQGLTYRWVQVSGPAASLDDPTSATPTFTAPEGLSNSEVVFELQVSDGTNTSVDTVNISINADNDAPTAEAGPDLVVDENQSITLQGSGTDPEGEGLSYQWVQISGPAMTLDDPSSATPTFTAPEGLSNSEVVFELQVSDGTNTSVDTVNISINADNDAPTAEAGPDLLVDENGSITLQGSGTDPEGEGLSYQWVQISGPAVTLDDPSSPTPSFTAPEGLNNSEVVFELQVSDGTNTSVDTVNISILADNDGPIADAGPDGVGFEREIIQLSGTGHDPEDEELTFHWVQISGPAVELDDPTRSEPSFRAPELEEDTEVVFRLEVSDGTNVQTDEVSIVVEARNDGPSADAGEDKWMKAGETGQLNGSGSDPDSTGLSYRWVQVSGPMVELDDPESPEPFFTAPVGIGSVDAVFELRVSDGTNETVDTVTLHISENPSDLSDTDGGDEFEIIVPDPDAALELDLETLDEPQASSESAAPAGSGSSDSESREESPAVESDVATQDQDLVFKKDSGVIRREAFEFPLDEYEPEVHEEATDDGWREADARDFALNQIDLSEDERRFQEQQDAESAKKSGMLGALWGLFRGALRTTNSDRAMEDAHKDPLREAPRDHGKSEHKDEKSGRTKHK